MAFGVRVKFQVYGFLVRGRVFRDGGVDAGVLVPVRVSAGLALRLLPVRRSRRALVRGLGAPRSRRARRAPQHLSPGEAVPPGDQRYSF